MNNDLERIEAYLSGQMNAEEQLTFEDEMARNKGLASAFALYQSIEHTMRSREQESGTAASLKRTLIELGAVYFKTPEALSEEAGGPQSILSQAKAPSVESDSNNVSGKEKPAATKFWRPWLKPAIAASLAGMIAVGIALYRQKAGGNSTNTANNTKPPAQANTQKKETSPATIPQDSPVFNQLPPSVAASEKRNGQQSHAPGSLNKAAQQALYARFYQPDAVPVKENEYLNEAFRFYKAGEYSKAAAAFEEVAAAPLTRGETSEEALTVFYAKYYQALSHMAVGNNSQAMASLEQLSVNDALLQAKVRWYLALAFLKAGQQEEARRLVRLLAADKAAKQFQQKARDLQKALPKE